MDSNQIMDKLRAITGHGAWSFENNRFVASDMVSSGGMAQRVASCLQRVLVDGAKNPISANYRQPYTIGDSPEADFFDTVSVKASALDLEKLAKAKPMSQPTGQDITAYAALGHSAFRNSGLLTL